MNTLFFGSKLGEDVDNYIDELQMIFRMMRVDDVDKVDLDAYNSRMLLGPGLISRRKLGVMLLHLQVGLCIRRFPWGISFLKS